MAVAMSGDGKSNYKFPIEAFCQAIRRSVPAGDSSTSDDAAVAATATSRSATLLDRNDSCQLEPFDIQVRSGAVQSADQH